MNAPKKILSLVGGLALLSSMTLGVASAQSVDDSSIDVSVAVTCSFPNSVNITGNGAFSGYDIASLGDGKSSTAPEALQVEVNVGCYLGPWEVNAEITNFRDGLKFFPGSNFSMEKGTVSSPYAVVEPDASNATFTQTSWSGADADNAIFETHNLLTLPWWLGGAEIDAPAPFISTATYTGHLDHLNQVLPGDYEAELTVELVLD